MSVKPGATKPKSFGNGREEMEEGGEKRDQEKAWDSGKTIRKTRRGGWGLGGEGVFKSQGEGPEPRSET